MTAILAFQGGPLLQKERAFADLGSSIGHAGLLIVDLGTGTQIVASSSLPHSQDNCYWVSLAPVVQPQRFDPVYASGTRPLAYAIARLIAADMDADGAPELVLLDRRGGVEIHDLESREVEASWRLLSASGVEIVSADLDQDGAPELLILDGTNLVCSDAGGQQLWSVPCTAKALIAADLDGDALPEVVLEDGRALDGLTLQLEWTQPALNGTVLAFGDVDGDGTPEIVAAERMHLAAYGSDGAEIWRFLNTQGHNGQLRLENLDADPGLEMVLSDQHAPLLQAWDGASLALDVSFDLLQQGVESFAFGDPDRDGLKDLVWSTHPSHNHDQYLRTRDLASGAVEFTSKMLIGPFHGPVKGDVDGDGTDELLMLSTESGNAPVGSNSGLLVSLNPDTLEIEGISDPFDHPSPNFTTSSMTALALHDLDGDGQPEILMGSVAAGNGFVMVARQSPWGTFSLLFVSAELPEGHVTTIACGDLNGDLQPEVVVGTYGYFNRPATVQVLDGVSGAVMWRSAPIGLPQASVADLLLANVDGDPALEICAIAGPGDLYVWDGATLLAQPGRPGSYTCLEPLQAGGRTLLAAGDDQGRIEILDGSSGALILQRTIALPEGPVLGLSYSALPTPMLLAGARGLFAILPGLPAPILLTDEFVQPIGRSLLLAPDLRHLHSSVPYGLQVFTR